MAVKWSYYDKYNDIINKYMPASGEGETKASQIATAVNKLIYKWYNDGDVFDNTYHLYGWCNDLSSYANWLCNNANGSYSILSGIKNCHDDSDYENLLKDLADAMLDEEYLAEQDKIAKTGSIYQCNGVFEFRENYNSNRDDFWDDDYWR